MLFPLSPPFSLSNHLNWHGFYNLPGGSSPGSSPVARLIPRFSQLPIRPMIGPLQHEGNEMLKREIEQAEGGARIADEFGNGATDFGLRRMWLPAAAALNC